MDEIVPESDLSDDDTEVHKSSKASKTKETEGATREIEKNGRSVNGRRREASTRRERDGLIEVVSRITFADETQVSGWSELAIATPSSATDADDTDEEVSEHPVNSVVKLRLFPTPTQKSKLDLMFATNRAVYNKLLACSREDRHDEKMKISDLMKKFRPIAVLKSMAKFFRNNKRARARYKLVQDDVRDSAFRDFKKAVKSSRAQFFERKTRDEKTSYPARPELQEQVRAL
ncbi:hypothetical protein V7S43_014022 [Phytophthora oleae]|uniref:Transposase putative helix-turn-helix domain-containing protein n=1 Tax=Phytophthora oleae TaxID=2107226 RepID=A0ABD3F3N5_9STRA